MKFNKKRKLMLVLLISVFVLTGCGSGGSDNNSVDNIVQEQGYGSIEGYIYKTSSDEYVFDQSKSSGGVDGAQVEIDGTIYTTNEEGYFKSSKLRAGSEYGVNIVIERVSKENFVWSKNVAVHKNKTVNLNDLSVEKNWNIILFISDKNTDSLKHTVDYFLDIVDYSNDLSKLNFFIIHGEYIDGKETNKAYYLTSNGKTEVKDYGSTNFNDPSFMRSEIQKITREYPSQKTMVSVLSHGNGWENSENPGAAPNWLLSDHAHHDGNTVKALDSYELYEMFNNIGFNIDIFNYSACHMGQIEVISSLPEEVKYAMASPSFGYTEDMNVHVDLIEDINSGVLDSETLGKRYIDHYVNNLNNDFATDKPSVKALYKLENINIFIDSFESLALKLDNYLSNNSSALSKFQDDIMTSNKTIQSYYVNGDQVGDSPTRVAEKDLSGLLAYLKNNYFDYGSSVVDQAEDAYNILNDIVVYSRNSEGSETTIIYNNVDENREEFTYANSNGLSITLKNSTDYENTWFNQKTNWNSVLEQVN